MLAGVGPGDHTELKQNREPYAGYLSKQLFRLSASLEIKLLGGLVHCYGYVGGAWRLLTKPWLNSVLEYDIISHVRPEHWGR